MRIDPRTPVLVGVGSSFADAEAVDLMTEAVLAAGADSGAPKLLGAVQRIAVPRGTWSYTDPARILAERIGAPHATTVLVDVGIPQQTLVDEALAAMLAGDLDVAVVVGGEAKARSARAQRRSTKGDREGMAQVFSRGGTEEAAATETDQGGAEPDVHQRPVGDLVDAAEIDAGLWAPVEQYALIESALGASQGLPPARLRTEIAALHARFNEVARTNPHAAFPAPMSATEIEAFGPANRPLAFPYAKWHVTQWTVDQAAALLLCTAEAAERFGVPRDRWVFPLVALSSSTCCRCPAGPSSTGGRPWRCSGRLRPRASRARSPTARSWSSARASRWRSGCSSASSGSRLTPRRRSRAAWRSPVGRSTASCSSRRSPSSSTCGPPAAGPW